MAIKKRTIIAAILASVSGFSAMTVASVLIAYDAVFPRVKRPDYAVTPGLVCYERLKNDLPRNEFFFSPKKDVQLKGYYYESVSKKGLVVLVHGFRSGADDYLHVTQSLVENGYNVFAYDCTGTYESSGEGTVGMCQSLVDLDLVLSYLESTPPYSTQPMFLVGHSWGGYAAASVLALHSGIRAAACLAPMYNGATMMIEKGEQYVGKLAVTAKPVFTVYQRMLFQDYVEHNSVRGINSVDIPVLVAHGVDDTTITYDGQSIMAHRDAITNPNVQYITTRGVQGTHDGILLSKQALLYRAEVASDLALIEKQKGKKLTNSELAEYYATVNHALYSQVNPELMSSVVAMFDGANK